MVGCGGINSKSVRAQGRRTRWLLLLVGGRSGVAIGPATFARKSNRGLNPDAMPGGGAELQHLKAPPKQVDVVDGLRALISAIDNPRRKQIAPILLADDHVLGTQRDPRSPTLSSCSKATSPRLPSPKSTIPNSPLRPTNMPVSSLVAPVKLATNKSAGRL